MAVQRHEGLDPDRPGWAAPGSGSMSREQRMLTACAWCERVNVEDDWLSASDAIRTLRTFDWPEPPLFTHGMCDHCLAFLTAGRPASNAVLPREAA